MKIEEVIAREEIRNLIATYATAGDGGRRELFTTVFCEDAKLSFPGTKYNSRNEIVEGLFSSVGNSTPAFQFARHNVTTSYLAFDEALMTARGRTYFVVYTEVGPDHSGVYTDVFRRDERGEWKIADRKVKIEYINRESCFFPGGL